MWRGYDARNRQRHPRRLPPLHRVNRNAVSAERCEECDEPIPEPRRAAVPGCQTCASCQADLELIRKQRGS
ncbi:TraR/DksA C4-type zinc finger protein [Enterobacter asburiae]|nr:hypothetical protein MC67_24370 [Enterobacter cloacae complex sp.]EJY4120651.1 TraR/DksA C4-type zinc finger protein [Enterobacter asburiae]